jgi:hypothetical protein
MHRLGLVIGVVGDRELLREEPEVLVDLAVAVVVEAVQNLFVHPPVAVVVDVTQRAEPAEIRGAHVVRGIERGPELEQRAARDVRLIAVAEGAHPQRGVVERLVSRADRILERGIVREPDVEERVADDARVRDPQRVVAGGQAGAAVAVVEHRARGRGKKQPTPQHSAARAPHPPSRQVPPDQVPLSTSLQTPII